jgi:hypothetical protein
MWNYGMIEPKNGASSAGLDILEALSALFDRLAGLMRDVFRFIDHLVGDILRAIAGIVDLVFHFIFYVAHWRFLLIRSVVG